MSPLLFLSPELAYEEITMRFALMALRLPRQLDQNLYLPMYLFGTFSA